MMVVLVANCVISGCSQYSIGSPDGRILDSSGADKTVRIWDVSAVIPKKDKE